MPAVPDGPPDQSQDAGPSREDHDDDDDVYGMDIDFDPELEKVLLAAESQPLGAASLDPEILRDVSRPDESKAYLAGDGENAGPSTAAVASIGDIEDLDLLAGSSLSPFDEFRRKGWLSVSDLVGGIWCEVQYDYRLRSLPFLPPSQRPEVITSKTGEVLPVDKIKVEGKERILKRGQKIHKRLEREIHPEEVIVKAETREDVWGLRFLNMFSAVEALLSLGKCREMPVVGFIKGVLVMGIIDEITRQPVKPPSSPSPAKTRSTTQKTLTSFFTSSSPSSSTPSKSQQPERTHKLAISDSKTRASGVLPRESDTLAGRLQCMVYKELLDALLLSAVPRFPSFFAAKEGKGKERKTVLPTDAPFDWAMLYAHLDLDSAATFSEGFVAQSRAIVEGNGLRFGAGEARSLQEMVEVWVTYVGALGLGTSSAGKKSAKKGDVQEDGNAGRTEDRLELVYRRAGGVKRRDAKEKKGKRRKGRRKGMEASGEAIQEADEIAPGVDKTLAVTPGESPEDEEENRLIRLAIDESLKSLDAPRTTAAPDKLVEAGPEGASDTAGDTEAPGIVTKREHEPEEDDDDLTREEDELAWAVEMSLADAQLDAEEEGVVRVSTSQRSPSRPSQSALPDEHVATSSSPSSSRASSPPSPGSRTEAIPGGGKTSGSIIGKTVFSHSPSMLREHLDSAMAWWMGGRDAVGVSEEEARRCGWCEFEEGCEWRKQKAEEALERVRKRREKKAS